MAFTTADLDAIDRALVVLASGGRTAQVTFSDGRAVRYAEATLPQLRELRTFVASQVTPIGQDPSLMAGGVTYVEWTRE